MWQKTAGLPLNPAHSGQVPARVVTPPDVAPDYL